MQSSKVKIKKSMRGFALLIAVVISTIILTIGISIVNTALKEVLLSSTLPNSLTSFYAADSGAECVLYWDNVRGNFTKASAFIPAPPGPVIAPMAIECMGITVSNIIKGPHVELWLRDENNLGDECVFVTIDASANSSDLLDILIDSWGFNTCDTKSTRRVDRALQLKYIRQR